MTNITQHGACNWVNRVRANYKVFPPQLGKLLEMHVAAIPSAVGASYILHMTYEHGDAKFDGVRRTERLDVSFKDQ